MSAMPHASHPGSVLAAEYVLGLLGPIRRAEAEHRLAEDRAFAADVRFWQDHFAGLDGGFEPVTPPAATFARIERRLFPASRAAGWWNSLSVWRGLAATGFALAALTVTLNLMAPAPVDPQRLATQLVAALEQEGSAVRFLALYDGATGTMRLTALSGEAVPEHDYELWAIEPDAVPVSMGVIPVGQRSVLDVAPAIIADFGEGTVLAITLEPLGGSPTGDPTGPVVAQGAAMPI